MVLYEENLSGIRLQISSSPIGWSGAVYCAKNEIKRLHCTVFVNHTKLLNPVSNKSLISLSSLALTCKLYVLE